VSAGPTQYSAPNTYATGNQFYPQQQQQQQQPFSYPQQQPVSGSQILNPFPLNDQSASSAKYDPETEAQIAQWQSAYISKDSDHSRRIEPHIPHAERATTTIDVGKHATPSTSGVAAVVSGTDGKQKTVVRSGGGKTWQDPSLLEWDPSHPRLFIGNLAGEVMDESLFKAFQRYPSVVKARVVRDKRTTKSKGYGFVSFSNSDDYFQAAKEMQGKYVGSHPILIKRSTTEIKAVKPGQAQQKAGKYGKKGGKHGGGHGSGAGGGNVIGGGGVQKKLPKKKGGLKLLG
jgi:hypothetical protein